MKQQHGAVLVKSGRVISVGWNVLKNDPNNISENHMSYCSVHAEAMAIARASRPAGATIYIARSKKGQERFSKPCRGCERTLIEAGVARVVYTVDT